MPTTSPKTAPYGSWKSPITSSLIVAQSVGLAEVLTPGHDAACRQDQENILAAGTAKEMLDIIKTLLPGMSAATQPAEITSRPRHCLSSF